MNLGFGRHVCGSEDPSKVTTAPSTLPIYLACRMSPILSDRPPGSDASCSNVATVSIGRSEDGGRVQCKRRMTFVSIQASRSI